MALQQTRDIAFFGERGTDLIELLKALEQIVNRVHLDSFEITV
jgi:hypothetical protein